MDEFVAQPVLCCETKCDLSGIEIGYVMDD
jgi:hypothetical protein